MYKIYIFILMLIFISPSFAASRRLPSRQANFSQQQNNNQSVISPVSNTLNIDKEKEQKENADKEKQISDLSNKIKQLQDDLVKIDIEINRCKKAKSNWRGATIIGGVGVIGTTTGAVAQGIQLKKIEKANKEKLLEKNAENTSDNEKQSDENTKE